MQNSDDEPKREIAIFPTMFLMRSLEDPTKWEAYDNFNGEPVNWIRKYENTTFSKGGPK